MILGPVNTLQLWPQSPYPSVASQRKLLLVQLQCRMNLIQSSVRKKQDEEKKKKAVPVSKRKSKEGGCSSGFGDRSTSTRGSKFFTSGVTMLMQTNPMNKYCNRSSFALERAHAWNW